MAVRSQQPASGPAETQGVIQYANVPVGKLTPLYLAAGISTRINALRVDNPTRSFIQIKETGDLIWPMTLGWQKSLKPGYTQVTITWPEQVGSMYGGDHSEQASAFITFTDYQWSDDGGRTVLNSMSDLSGDQIQTYGGQMTEYSLATDGSGVPFFSEDDTHNIFVLYAFTPALAGQKLTLEALTVRMLQGSAVTGTLSIQIGPWQPFHTGPASRHSLPADSPPLPGGMFVVDTIAFSDAEPYSLNRSFLVTNSDNGSTNNAVVVLFETESPTVTVAIGARVRIG